jgi:hypothetical protein
VDKVLPNQSDNQLHVPKITNDAAIDAWIPGIGAIQMIVGKKRIIKGGDNEDLSMLVGAKRLYWLRHPLYYHSSTKKSPQDIE